jgi:hypothetical protein
LPGSETDTGRACLEVTADTIAGHPDKSSLSVVVADTNAYAYATSKPPTIQAMIATQRRFAILGPEQSFIV